MTDCFYCGTSLAPRHARTPDALTSDHVVPKRALRNVGWLFPHEWHALNNVPACRTCNERKGSTPPHVFYRTLTDPEAKGRLYARMLALGIPEAQIAGVPL